MNDALKKAYEITIEDLRIELCNTPWWKFKRVDCLQKDIECYENLLYINKNNE